MIKIRSITYNLPSDYKDSFANIADSIKLWDLQKYYVRTKRLSLPILDRNISIDELKKIKYECNKYGIRWFLLPVDPYINTDLFNSSYNILKEIDQIFLNVLCVKNGELDLNILDKSIRLVKKTSEISNNGKDNFRLGLSVNMLYDCPFFPFAMSSGNFNFSIALELTQEINAIINSNKKKNLTELRDIILKTIIPQIDEIYKEANIISMKTNIPFSGFDFSIAPIIDEGGSVIDILKHIGIEEFGKNGTLYATSYLTNILKYFGTVYKTVGFSGVMYSLLEDLELCAINNCGKIELENLIKLSTMCGCGIDMIPINCDTTNSEMQSAIMDIYSISTRLNKPLGVRFLPIPKTHKNVLSYTNFNEDADFIANTRVLTLSDNKLNITDERNFKYLKN